MVTRRGRTVSAAIWIALVSVLGSSATVRSQSQTFSVRPGGWVPTGIHMKRGDSVSIAVSGELNWPGLPKVASRFGPVERDLT